MDALFGRLSRRNTYIHRIDPRVKIISTVSFVIVTSTFHSVSSLIPGILLMLGFLAAVRIPWAYALRRLSWMLMFGGVLIILFPFITPGKEIIAFKLGSMSIAATGEGLDKAVILFCRVLSALLALTLLNATTSFREIINGLRHLHMPRILVSLLEFTVRYIFVLNDELQRMKLARKARAYDLNRSILHRDALKTMTQLLAVLFLRSVERGERVFHAMLARGYGGEDRCCGSCRLKTADLMWGTAFVLFALSLKIIEVGGFFGLHN